MSFTSGLSFHCNRNHGITKNTLRVINITLNMAISLIGPCAIYTCKFLNKSINVVQYAHYHQQHTFRLYLSVQLCPIKIFWETCILIIAGMKFFHKSVNFHFFFCHLLYFFPCMYKICFSRVNIQ